MARYIDADEIIEVLQGWREDSAMYDGSGNPVDSILYDVIRWIEDTPTADVAPRAEVELWKGRTEAVFAAIPETRREFAREIFREIDKLHIHVSSHYDANRYTALKNKYTGGNNL